MYTYYHTDLKNVLCIKAWNAVQETNFLRDIKVQGSPPSNVGIESSKCPLPFCLPSDFLEIINRFLLVMVPMPI